MTYAIDILKRLARPAMIVALALLLLLGARVGLSIRACTGIAVASSAGGQNPNQSEEEERHEGHSKATTHRRQAVGVPGLARTGIAPSPFGFRLGAAGLAGICATSQHDHESDYRNGIGAPLRC